MRAGSSVAILPAYNIVTAIVAVIIVVHISMGSKCLCMQGVIGCIGGIKFELIVIVAIIVGHTPST